MDESTRQGAFWDMLAGRIDPPPVASPGEFAPTADLHVQYLRPARPI
ncbi:MAG TPA: hypothetical protein VH761_17740 [Ilumatobacteraceae bacterium]|jgi:hypothetical protein